MHKYYFPPVFSSSHLMDDGGDFGSNLDQSPFFSPLKSSAMSNLNDLEKGFAVVELEDRLEAVQLDSPASPKCVRMPNE